MSIRKDWLKAPFRCEICGVVVLDQERMIVLSVQKVRRKMGPKPAYVALQDEFPSGAGDSYFHEACFFKSSERVIRELYDGELPVEPRQKRVRSKRRR